MIWANRSLDLITIGSAIYCNAFFLSWSEQTWQTCYLLVQMTIYGENSYLGHIFQDVGLNLWFLSTVSAPVRWLTHILRKTLDSSALEPCRSTTPRKEDNSAQSCNFRFSNRDGDKETKFTDCSFKYECVHKYILSYQLLGLYRTIS